MSLDAKAWTKNSNNDNHKAYKVEDAIDTKSNKVRKRPPAWLLLSPETPPL